LSRFLNLEVVYVKGIDNPVADFMSRWAYPASEDVNDSTLHGSDTDAKQVFKWDKEVLDEDFATADVSTQKSRAALGVLALDVHEDTFGFDILGSEPADLPFWRDWSKEYSRDLAFKKPWKQLLSDSRKLGSPSDSFFIWNNRLRHEGRICVPQVLKTEVVQQLHDFGHGGPLKQLEMPTRRYNFSCSEKALKELIQKVYSGCAICKVAKHTSGLTKSEPFFHPIPSQVFSSLSLDFVDLDAVTTSQGKFDAAMVIVDRCSGYIIAEPIRKLGFNGVAAAQMFFRWCFSFMGMPSEIFFRSGHQSGFEFFTNSLCVGR
jgi:hypothetical protein